MLARATPCLRSFAAPNAVGQTCFHCQPESADRGPAARRGVQPAHGRAGPPWAPWPRGSCHPSSGGWGVADPALVAAALESLVLFPMASPLKSSSLPQRQSPVPVTGGNCPPVGSKGTLSPIFPELAVSFSALLVSFTVILATITSTPYLPDRREGAIGRPTPPPGSSPRGGAQQTRGAPPPGREITPPGKPRPQAF